MSQHNFNITLVGRYHTQYWITEITHKKTVLKYKVNIIYNPSHTQYHCFHTQNNYHQTQYNQEQTLKTFSYAQDNYSHTHKIIVLKQTRKLLHTEGNYCHTQDTCSHIQDM